MKNVFCLIIVIAGSFARAGAPDKAVLKLNFAAQSQHAGFAYGVAKGIYAAHGIDLQLIEGVGGSATVLDVNSSSPPRFAYGNSPSLIELPAGKLEAKVISQLQYTSGVGLAFLENSGIRSPNDLKGKRLGFIPGEAPRALLPSFLKANGLSIKDVEVVDVTMKNRFELLKTKKVDGIGAKSNLVTEFNKQAGSRLFNLNYALSGLPSLGEGLMVNAKFLKSKEDRDLNCRMVRATNLAWKEAAEHPKEALEALAKLFPASTDNLTEQGWLATYQYSQTRSRANKATGMSSAEDWKNMIDIFDKAAVKRPVEDYFTNDFFDCRPVAR